ncbi:TetR family transcriptional regulator [Sediminivirga luteola]|nr:TetR family transcriptional regulator [Sediminivirga luteola]MCI2265027.1 TetR family transcriptional regulator [Sediminivirga luteola]
MRSPQIASDTRTRILEAAVDRFGRDGFGASLRAIAADAGVSAAAVMKHFGSKESLHRECDAHVLAVISAYKTEAMKSADLGATLMTQMARMEEFQPLIRYTMRSFLAGGDVARNLLEDMRSRALTWMAEGVKAGHLKPSRNEELRVKLTFSISIGWMVQSVLAAEKDLGELDADFWARTFDEMLMPALELYAEGLFADRTLLEHYMLYRSDPPGESGAEETSA